MNPIESIRETFLTIPRAGRFRGAPAVSRVFRGLLGILLLAAPLPSAVEIHVATDGEDGNPATRERPVRTLEKARALSREVKGQAVTVLLHGGTWFREKPLSFTPEDSGSAAAPKVWASAPGEKATVMGAKPVTGWIKTASGAYVAAVEKGRVFHQLFENDLCARKARYPNEGYLTVAEGLPLRNQNGDLVKHKLWGTVTSKLEFIYKEGDLPSGDLTGAEVYLWAGFDWFANLLPVSNIDRAARRIRLARETLTPIVIRTDRRYYLQGFHEALDSTGEFFLDAPAGALYYRPMNEPIAAQRIAWATATRIIEVIGKSPQDPVHHLSFIGIDFIGSEFTGSFMETSGTHGNGVWNEPMNKEAAVYFENTASCSIERSRILNAGYSAVAFVWGGISNRVVECEIANPGFHGVLLSGYRAQFGVNADFNRGHLIDDNWIHHVGRNVGHGAAVFLWASGQNCITHNAMHDSPRYAVCIKGEGMAESSTAKWNGAQVTYRNRYPYIHSRSNLIADNDIFRVSADTEDNGFISFWYCGAGNQVIQNLMHDSARALPGLGMAVYLDDGSDYCHLSKNIIWGVVGGDSRVGFFNKGQYNIAENNILVMDGKAVAALRMWEGFGNSAISHTYRRNLFITAGNSAPAIFDFAGWDLPRLTSMDHNLYFNPDDSYPMKGTMTGGDMTLDDWIARSGYDKASRIADPLFVDATNHDYRLAANSPAWALGFEKIDAAQIGLRPASPFFAAQRAMQKALGCLPDFSGNPALPRPASAYRHVPKSEGEKPVHRWFSESGVAAIYKVGGIKMYVEAPTSIDLSAQGSSAGKPCLMFRDGPGPKYDPRLMINTLKTTGHLRIAGTFRQDREHPVAFTFEPRQLTGTKGAYATGTVLVVSRDGIITADDRETARIPPGSWVDIEMNFQLGKKERETWRLVLKSDGQILFNAELPKKDTDFTQLERIVLFGHEQAGGEFFVGRLEISIDP